MSSPSAPAHCFARNLNTVPHFRRTVIALLILITSIVLLESKLNILQVSIFKLQANASLRAPDKFLTLAFGGACQGRTSNKVFEFISLYGMARTLNRVPYVDLSAQCARQALDELVSYFPRLRQAFQSKSVNHSTVHAVNLKNGGCCNYGDVEQLKDYQSSEFLKIDNYYLQSYKYFHSYRKEVLELLTFTEEDINVTNSIAKEAFRENYDVHKICVHTRRTDFVDTRLQRASTKEFTKSAALYIRQKLLDRGKKVAIALLGDDRPWLTTLIKDEAWAVVPRATNKPSTDYAFFARHCQTVLLTASASSFGFWTAYLSSAEKIYFNIFYGESSLFIGKIVIDDFFPMEWVALSQDKQTSVITEVVRSLKPEA